MARATFDNLGWVRDAVQARVIAQIFAQRVHDVALKGGMAFRVAHEKWARATKDIDLDAGPNMPLSALQSVMRRAVRLAAGDGFLENVVITEPKQTETTARWKIAGTDPRTGQDLNLTVEVSRRDAVEEDDVRKILFGPGEGEWVTVYNDTSLAFKKVKALLSDTREAPRDVCDLYLLIQAQVEPPIEKLKAWLATEGGADCLEQMWAKIERMDRELFRAEVLPTLPPTPDGQWLYQDWEDIRLAVGEAVEQWIRVARGEAVALSRAPAPGQRCAHP